MDQFDYSNGENGKQNKNSGKALIITLIAVFSVLIIASSAFLIHEIRTITGDKSVTRSGSGTYVTLAENEGGKTGADSVTVPVVSELTEDTEIKKTETQAKTYVIDVSEVVENVMPSVVAIVDTLETTQSYNPFNYFFGGDSSGSSQISSASGSGVIIGVKDGELLIVTNNHVVSNESTSSYYSTSSKGLTVTFCDGEEAPATIKGTDKTTDLAVIAVDMDDLSTDTKDAIRIAVLGSSDDAKIGSGVIVIGNAGGYGQSVTSGIISAKDREVTIDNITRKLIQTDAAINPGNSGGGMFNAAGELIGINCAKTVSTNIEGMGFAIPITSVKTVIENLMNRETVAEEDQGYLGINGETIPDTWISRYGYPAGVSIQLIGEGSPAEKAGLQLRDIITKVNDLPVSSMEELKAAVNGYKAGTTITLTVSRSEGRGFREFTMEVTLVRQSELK